MLQYKKHLQ